MVIIEVEFIDTKILQLYFKNSLGFFDSIYSVVDHTDVPLMLYEFIVISSQYILDPSKQLLGVSLFIFEPWF